MTETAAFDGKTAAIAHNLARLADEGISIALDDFGTGFASLVHLTVLPISCVKIDRSFVRNMLVNHDSRSIVEAIVRLSQNLGKYVVAEGVETEAQLAAIRELQCDAAQGFLFSKPLASNDIASFFLNRAAQRLHREPSLRNKVIRRAS